MGDPSARPLLTWWVRLSSRPGGRWLFSRLLSRWVPYTGSIRPRVRELRPGYARIIMEDRRGVRNHLNSIHAIALVNLGEVTSGLAMVTALPPGVRSIVTGLTVEFLKKARGTVEATCRCEIPGEIITHTEQLVVAEITDPSEEVVARTSVRWRLSPPS